MRFFWLLTVITLLTIYFHSVTSEGLILIIMLIITDFMVLWVETEFEKNNGEKSFLLEKIEILEKLTSDMFDKLNKRFSNNKNDKKDIIESLNQF